MRWLFLLIVIVFATGCSPSDRKLVGPYSLERFDENGKFYINKAGVDLSGGGIIDGIALRIGWNSHYIVAERYSMYRGDPDGWMIIDVKTGAMSGPFSEADFQTRPESKGIKIYEASEAWKSL